jgi:acetylaranotin biosynthesis cluster protein L
MSQALHHEHIVRINDPANVAGAWLTREQLWAGLQHTVLAPELLDQSIDSASIQEIVPGRLRREIRRGRSAISDEVELVPNDSLRIRADAAGAFAGSTLTIRIEEPAPEMLFVRFTYDVCGLEDARDEQEDTARCSAYQDSDVERIRQVRKFLRQGLA